MVNKLVKWTIMRLIAYCRKTGKVIDIIDRDKDGYAKPELYMRRYRLIHNKLFCLYIHRFFKSDDETHHDHPWNFFTWVIDGGYDEERLISKTYSKFKVWPASFEKKKIHRAPGSIAYRRGTDIHRVIIDRTYGPEEEHVAPLTVCFVGPRMREWGFWTESRKSKELKSWVVWTEFLGIDPGSSKFKGHS